MQTVAPQGRRWVLPAVITALAIVAATSCIVSGDLCGPHQVEASGMHAICVCEPGAVIDADEHGCTPCGTDEEVVNDKCVCKAGFAKAALDAACKASGVGESCSSESECHAEFPYCVLDDADGGYCSTVDCARNADCPSGWSCEADGDTRYCRKAPSGLGVSCQSPSDCADFEAQYCETLQTHSCALGDCASSGNACPNEWGCCDYSALLGSPLSLCVDGDNLVGGACPSGGRLVSQ